MRALGTTTVTSSSLTATVATTAIATAIAAATSRAVRCLPMAVHFHAWRFRGAAQ